MSNLIKQPVAGQPCEEKCVCRHGKQNHIIEGNEACCIFKGCDCSCFQRWETVVRDEAGQAYLIHDVRKFCRVDFSELFDPAELEVKKAISSDDTWTSAERGLCCLAEERLNSWKGWTLVVKARSFTK